MKWLNENTWDAAIKASASRNNVDPALIKAVIGRESGFRANAWRAEPTINDGSSGLMQILLATARGMGYTGGLGSSSNLSGLFDPATNIEYGTRFLRSQLDRTHSIPGAISAYNGGYRPSLGFGVPATKALRVCLAYSQTEVGKCISWRDVQPGEYANQSHVDTVMGNLAYFQSLASVAQRPATPNTPDMPTRPTSAGVATGGGSQTASVGLGAMLLAAILMVFGFRRKGR